MALKRNKSNIVNLALAISNEDGKAGMTIDQTILNGKSAAVQFRLINGAKSLELSSLTVKHAKTCSRLCKRFLLLNLTKC